MVKYHRYEVLCTVLYDMIGNTVDVMMNEGASWDRRVLFFFALNYVVLCSS